MDIHHLKKEDKIKYLSEFEEEIAEIYKTGIIKGPIHLRGGNERQLIDIFEDINKEDTIFATWANHLEALLHGVPRDKIKQRILDGHSMAMNFPEHNFYTSAIVGGICPIATGVAWSLNEDKVKKRKVVAFIGDMTLFTGIAQESIRYSMNYNLPIMWVIADNNLSVDTLTEEVWMESPRNIVLKLKERIKLFNLKTEVKYYSYKNKWPHSGVGAFVSF